MGKAYKTELDDIATTLKWTEHLPAQPALFPTGQHGLLYVIGAGGSFSAAEFAAAGFRRGFDQAAEAVTPLEYLQRASRAGTEHAALIISAEGRNKDVLQAAALAASRARSVTALTFNPGAPLQHLLEERVGPGCVTAIRAPWGKDGYLATNSLIASVAALGRGLGIGFSVADILAEFEGVRDRLPNHSATAALAATHRLLVLHAESGRPAAVDIESKFAEAALGTAQKADLRQFAHGRHIQLEQGLDPLAILAYVNEDELDLWLATRRHLPPDAPLIACLTPSNFVESTLMGLCTAYALVGAVASRVGRDPGQPAVPTFARRLHALGAAPFLPSIASPSPSAKVELLVRVGHTLLEIDDWADAYLQRLRTARIRGVVLDFDGTCCETAKRLDGVDARIARQMERLLDGALMLALASGRGDSLHANLRQRVDARHWRSITLGCHSGATLLQLGDDWSDVPTDADLGAAAGDLQRVGIESAAGYRTRIHAGQLTIEAASAYLLARAQLAATEIVMQRPGWRVLRSSHSVDLLTPQADKRRAVDRLVELLGVDAADDILRIGDRGEEGGNDWELLASGLSISVDGVSPDPAQCWDAGSRQATGPERTLAVLEALTIVEPGVASFDQSALKRLFAKHHDATRLLRRKVT